MDTKIPIAIAHIDPTHNIEFTPSPAGAIKVPNHLLTEISECQHEIEVSSGASFK